VVQYLYFYLMKKQKKLSGNHLSKCRTLNWVHKTACIMSQFVCRTTVTACPLRLTWKKKP